MTSKVDMNAPNAVVQAIQILSVRTVKELPSGKAIQIVARVPIVKSVQVMAGNHSVLLYVQSVKVVLELSLFQMTQNDALALVKSLAKVLWLQNLKSALASCTPTIREQTLKYWEALNYE